MQGSFRLGGQEQFYLEGQISYAIPQEDGGLLVHCSTQHPSEMQHLVAHALGLASHRVQVQCRRMGGGFGGKESQSALFACVAALAARALQRPVKLRPDRDDDMLITGRRHGFDFQYDVGFDDAGRVLGVTVEMLTNAGHSADLSPPVMTRALCHFDNAYWLPHVALHGYCARTNTQSNTAFRGFGGPQGALAVEVILDEVARRLGGLSSGGLGFTDTGNKAVIGGLALTLDAPRGFAISNSSQAVTGSGPGNLRFDLRAADARNADLNSIAGARWQQLGVSAQPMRATRINGVEALEGSIRAGSQAGPVEATLTVYRWSPQMALTLVSIAPQGQLTGVAPVAAITPFSTGRRSPGSSAITRLPVWSL